MGLTMGTKGLWFKNPANGYLVQINWPGLWTLLFGGFYFMVHGAWTHVFLSFFLSVITGGIAWVIYPFFAKGILEHHYLKRGWIRA